MAEGAGAGVSPAEAQSSTAPDKGVEDASFSGFFDPEKGPILASLDAGISGADDRKSERGILSLFGKAKKSKSRSPSPSKKEKGAIPIPSSRTFVIATSEGVVHLEPLRIESGPMSWADYLPEDITEKLLVVSRAAFLRGTEAGNVLVYPKGFLDAMPRFKQYIIAAAKAAKMEVIESSVKVTLGHPAAWSTKVDEAEKYVRGLTDPEGTKAGEGDRMTLLSVTDFFQALAVPVGIDARTATPGGWTALRTVALALEEKAGRAMAETQKGLGRENAHQMLVEQMGRLMTVGSQEAGSIIATTENLLRALVRKGADHLDAEYKRRVVQASLASTTALAGRSFRRAKQKVLIPQQGKKKPIETTKVSILPPAVRLQKDSLVECFTPTEQTVLASLQKQVQETQSQKSLDAWVHAIETPSVRAEQIEKYIRNLYEVSDGINRVIHARESAIKSAAKSEADQLLKAEPEGSKKALKDVFTKEVFTKAAEEYVRTRTKAGELVSSLTEWFGVEKIDAGTVAEWIRAASE